MLDDPVGDTPGGIVNFVPSGAGRIGWDSILRYGWLDDYHLGVGMTGTPIYTVLRSEETLDLRPSSGVDRSRYLEVQGGVVGM